MAGLVINKFASIAVETLGADLYEAAKLFIEDCRQERNLEKLLMDVTDTMLKDEVDHKQLQVDLEIALSETNMKQLAKELHAMDGYDLHSNLYGLLMKNMQQHEIPCEVAEWCVQTIISTIVLQLRRVNAQTYNQYFWAGWKEEQNKLSEKLLARIARIDSCLEMVTRNNAQVFSLGRMDLEINKQSILPHMGINFFVVDDLNFQEEFEIQKENEKVFIRGRSVEETTYCVLNELWRLNEKRPVYVVRNIESWKQLDLINEEGNVYVAAFTSDEIPAIGANTCIFILSENTPCHLNEAIELRQRTYSTLLKCLEDAGMDYEEANMLMRDTHGLYIPMKKHLYNGSSQKKPEWVEHVSVRAKQVCLLMNKWQDIPGDKEVIAALYGDQYERFMDEITPFFLSDDPLVCRYEMHGKTYYYLASTELAWEYIHISINDSIWGEYVDWLLVILNEAERLFTLDHHQRVLAEIKGERLIWSKSIRDGMLHTLLMLSVYGKEKEQSELDSIVSQILSHVTNSDRWVYISDYWTRLCEISPSIVIKKLQGENEKPTGLNMLFEQQSSDFLFGKNAYINILWGVEQFLTQKQYFWNGYRWLVQLDKKNYKYVSNAPVEIFHKILCPWHEFSSINTVKEKIEAARILINDGSGKAWDYIYESIDSFGRSIVGELCHPQYRQYDAHRETEADCYRESYMGYLELLLGNMEFSVERWKRMLHLSEQLPRLEKEKVFQKLLDEVLQMEDIEREQIKNKIRHIIFRHRYFKDASWAMDERSISQYEELLEQIHVETPEYEYAYLFIQGGDFPLSHPVPYEEDGNRDNNEKATQLLLQKKIREFEEYNYDVEKLASLCAKKDYCSLGKQLGAYWNNGEWDNSVFLKLINVQENGRMALDYLAENASRKPQLYAETINNLQKAGCSEAVLVEVYRFEANVTDDLPLIASEAEDIKKKFWSRGVFCQKKNCNWAICESKKYSPLEVYINQIYMTHYRYRLSPEQIYEAFDQIEEMPVENPDQMLKYHVEQLLEILQDVYIDNPERCMRIAHLEMMFMQLLNWEKMKCFHHLIGQNAELLAWIVGICFKHDNEENNQSNNNEAYISNMFSLYNKLRFCPAEKNGEVDKEALKQYVESLYNLMSENGQAGIFTAILGRFFAYSPLGKDGYEPCEAVRDMIELYGDDSLEGSYVTCVMNQRGIYSPSAGREEKEIAQKYLRIADYHRAYYGKTSSIYDMLYRNYMNMSTHEREEAEHGW